MEQRTIEAVRASQTIDRDALHNLYIETHVEAAEFYDGLARRTIGRSPAHVLLLHETDLAALWIADLVAALRARGWEIVTADEAFADPIAREEPNSIRLPMGQIGAMADARGVPVREIYNPAFQQEWIAAAFATEVLHKAPKP